MQLDRCLLPGDGCPFAQPPTMRQRRNLSLLAPHHHSLARCAACPWPAVGKITGKEGLVFEGKALCFDCEEDMLQALEKDQNQFKVCAGCCCFVFFLGGGG